MPLSSKYYLLWLRIALIVILLAHSVMGILNNGINDFGNLYLNQIGFAPFGLYLAWGIKLSHIVTAFCLLLDQYIRPMLLLTIGILTVGIFLVHLPSGWFVVGGGQNGVEFNFLLIMVCLQLMFHKPTQPADNQAA